MRALRQINDLLRVETVEVTGCTEPASVAFTFHRARLQLRQPLDPMTVRARLDASSDVLRNASTAMVPFLKRRGLRAAGHEVVDFGDCRLDPDDDYPDFVVPLARAVARGEVNRGIAICGSGVGACVVANKVPGVRACLIHETFSAHQGVEDDDMNMICLGGLVVGHSLAWELVKTFLAARFSGAERHRRRLAKVADLENKR